MQTALLTESSALPLLLLAVCLVGLAVVLLLLGNLFNPKRPGNVKRMPYESGMDPIHDTRRRFDVRFHLLAIAFLVFDVELLFLYPWAVAVRAKPATATTLSAFEAASPGDENAEAEPSEAAEPVSLGIDAAVERGTVQSRDMVFAGVMVFIALLTLGFVYDWRKGVFRWR